MKRINIAISCAGSGIGQSVIDSCKLSELPIKTFGLDNNPLAYGLFDCDHIFRTPLITESNYLETIRDICVENNIHLLIPGIDAEIVLFSKNIDFFRKEGIELMVSEPPLVNLVRDKFRTTKELNKLAPIFVNSYSDKPSFERAYNNNEATYPIIAKPSNGSASANVHIINDASDLANASDELIFQELAKPHKEDPNFRAYIDSINRRINAQFSEISIQLIMSKEGDLIGKMASFNRLKNGIPVEIIPFENTEIWTQIHLIIPYLKKLGLRGPLNLQGRITDNGLKIFELNARFTGITGTRALMGFNEVEACIKSWMGLSEEGQALRLNSDLIGIRQVSSTTVSLEKNSFIKEIYPGIYGNKKECKKNILITGATGYVGRNLIDALISSDANFNIIALVRNRVTATKMLPKEVEIFEIGDLKTGVFSISLVHTLLHLGFARPHKGAEAIAASLAFSCDIIRRAIANNVPNIINISSQSVYGTESPSPWTEKTPVAPSTPYAMAKYTSELLLAELCHNKKQTNSTSIRLGTITGGAKGLVDIDIVSKFVKKIKRNEDIQVIGGTQRLQRLDIRDALDGIMYFIESKSKKWQPIYNLGPTCSLNLKDLTEKALSISKEYIESNTTVHFKEKESHTNIGLDSTLLKDDLGWSPTRTIDDTIHSLFQFDY